MMENSKRSRLKLKSKRSNMDIEFSKNKTGVETREDNDKVKDEMNMSIRDYRYIVDDVIHVTDDEHDDMQESLRIKSGSGSTIVDKKLIKLRENLYRYRMAPCDVWNLEDLPPYRTEDFQRPKRNDKLVNTMDSNDELLPLPRLRKDYLLSKRSGINLLSESDFCKNHNMSESDGKCSLEIKHNGKEIHSSKKRKEVESAESQNKRTKSSTDMELHNDFTDCNHGFTAINKDPVNHQPSCPPTTQLKEELTSRENEVKVKSCPICTMSFTHSKNLVDIDSHIAACLSIAGDDVVW